MGELTLELGRQQKLELRSVTEALVLEQLKLKLGLHCSVTEGQVLNLCHFCVKMWLGGQKDGLKDHKLCPALGDHDDDDDDACAAGGVCFERLEFPETND